MKEGNDKSGNDMRGAMKKKTISCHNMYLPPEMHFFQRKEIFFHCPSSPITLTLFSPLLLHCPSSLITLTLSFPLFHLTYHSSFITMIGDLLSD
jgi:hypothetical protein